MIKCDCNERVGIKVNSWKQFEDLKSFFKEQIQNGLFIEIPIEEPYHVGHGANGDLMEWYADKWYKCQDCGVVWEFVYPDFPAQGSVRKLSVNGYKEQK